MSQDIDIVDDQDKEWVDDRSKPEVELEDEQHQAFEPKINEPASHRVVERNDIRPKRNQCHDSGRRPREQEIHKE